jgi:ATP-dependent protease ClpP protease subunit
MANVKVDIIGEISEWYNSMPYLKYKIDEANGASIDFTISSGGGSVTEGMGMADLISTYSNETTATGIGLVASIATVVLLAADKVKMTENSFLMIHRPWSQAFGNSDELEATAELLDKMEEKLLDIYLSAVYKRKGEEKDLRKKIKKMMAAETWMTAQEALEFGFIDEIVKTDEKKIDLLPLQNSLSKFINVPAALLINNKKNDDMGNSILEKIKSLLNQTETLEVIDAPAVVDSKLDEVVITDEMAIEILKAKGYTVLNAEEMTALSEKSNEQSTSITEIETVLETLSTELVALRNQVKKGVGLPSGGTTAEKIIETKAKLSPFDSFASLVKSKISQR